MSVYLWILFVTTAIAALFFEESRFLVLLFYFLLAGVNLEGEWTEALHEPMIQARWAALILIVILSATSVFFGRGKIKKPGAFFLFFTPFFACILASTLYSNNPLITLFKVLSVSALFLCIYFMWRCRLSDTKKSLEIFHKNLFIYSVFIVSANLLASLFDEAYFTRGHYFRGIFENPNTIGLFMGIFCVPTMLHSLVVSKVPLIKIFSLFFLCASVAMLGFSYSRGGVLSAVSGCFIFTFFYFRKRWTLLLIIMLLGFIGLIHEIQPQFFQGFREEWVLKNRKPQEGVLSSRIEPWTQSLTKAKSQLWTGYGFGMVADFNDSWESRYESESSTRSRGSSFVSILEDVGVVGLLLFSSMLIYLVNPIRILRVKSTRPKEEFALVLLFYSVTIAGVVNALFEDWLLSVGWISTLLFWHTAAASTCFGED